MLLAAVILAGGSVRQRSSTAPAQSLAWQVLAAAQGPVSAALGRDEAEFAVRGMRARNRAQRLQAVFAHGATSVTSGSIWVRFTFAGYGRAGRVLRVPTGAPEASENRVRFGHGAVTEWWVNGPSGLEQTFDVGSRPPGATGPLTLSLGVSGNGRARLTSRDVIFERAHRGSLRYGGLVATDRQGHVLPSSMGLQAGHVTIRVDDRRAAYPVRVDPFVQQAERRLADGAPGDLFAVPALSGDTLVVGAPGRSVGANQGQGAVYVFQRPASGWANAVQVAQLTASDGAASDRLGGAVAMDGDTIVAGAAEHKVGPNDAQGAVYVFVKPGAGWRNATQSAELTASDGNTGDGFGAAVDISGGTIVVGPLQHTVDGKFRQGEGYAFLKAQSGWADARQSAILRAQDGAAEDNLGRSVAISGEQIVLGAPNHKIGNNADQGAAYLFAKPDGMVDIEQQSAELTATDGAANDQLGSAVAMSATAIVAGAPNHQVGLARQGAAYVFARGLVALLGNVTQTAELTASDGVTGDRFGSAVATSGDHVVVGSYLHQVGPNQAQGAAYVFTRPGFVWRNATESAELTAPDGVATDLFGLTLATAGNLVAVGGGLHVTSDVIGSGAVYVFGAVPQIVISSPVAGSTLNQGAVATASFSCAPAGNAPIASCTGSAANGALLDTGSVGTHNFTVTAIDSDGVGATRSVTYNVVSAPKSTATPPSITAVHQTAAAWRRGRPLAPHAKTRRYAIGTTFSFTLDQPAMIAMRFVLQLPGREAHGRCVRPTAAGKRSKSCVRTVVAGELDFGGQAGRNSVAFRGQIPHSRTLRPGRYTMEITATNGAGQRSSARPLRFTIVR
jgi:FG-GAP repeat